jgi:imidazolonepropionase-like amidohydrolase
VGATLHDGSGGPPLQDAVVIVRDGRFESLGPAASTPVPPDAERIDLAGRFLTPGLIDTHVHYSQTGWADGRPDAMDLRDEHPYPEAMAELARHPERFHRAFLLAGVTAVLDVGGYPWTRELGRSTETSSEAPHVLAAGPLLATWVPDELGLPDQSQFVLMTDERTVREAVASHAAQGSDVLKVWLIVADRPLDELAPLVEAAGAAAREHGLPLVVHATELEAARLAVRAGARLLVHSVDDAPVDDGFLDLCRERGVFYCPTLTVVDGYRHLARGRLPESLQEQLEDVSPWVRERVLATPPGQDLAPASAARWQQAAETRKRALAENLARVHAAGIPVVLGTDAGNPLTLHGPSVVPELLAMQAAGLSPAAVLRSATSDAARALGRDDLGLVTPGRTADLLVLEADPGLDVANLARPLLVLRGGVLHRRLDLAFRNPKPDEEVSRR